MLASKGPFNSSFALVQARLRSHFRGSASRGGSNMRLSCGNLSSLLLASPLPALPYSPGSNASGFAAAALLVPPSKLDASGTLG